MAATLDTISGGRLELGIGAGWGKKEHEAYGIPFEEKPSVRIKQMKEAVQILIKMWTEDKPTFRGKYYTIVEAINNPKPIQKPHPPIYVGGRGKQLTLKVAAQLADGTNLGGRCSVKDAEEALIALKKHCAEVGRDFDGITKSYESEFTIIDEDKTNVQNKIKKYMPRITLGKPTRVEDFISWNLIGTPHEIIDRIQEYVDVGIDYFILRFPDGLEIEPLQLFADEVMSSF
jgi:alkanesulfonate monooxygenase SsuD/methylene tetrahydromethanopterin reductase-like flavin-dependent oxidoreductase (luciferase family)